MFSKILSAIGQGKGAGKKQDESIVEKFESLWPKTHENSKFRVRHLDPQKDEYSAFISFIKSLSEDELISLLEYYVTYGKIEKTRKTNDIWSAIEIVALSESTITDKTFKYFDTFIELLVYFGQPTRNYPCEIIEDLASGKLTIENRNRFYGRDTLRVIGKYLNLCRGYSQINSTEKIENLKSIYTRLERSRRHVNFKESYALKNEIGHFLYPDSEKAPFGLHNNGPIELPQYPLDNKDPSVFLELATLLETTLEQVRNRCLEDEGRNQYWSSRTDVPDDEKKALRESQFIWDGREPTEGEQTALDLINDDDWPSHSGVISGFSYHRPDFNNHRIYRSTLFYDTGLMNLKRPTLKKYTKITHMINGDLPEFYDWDAYSPPRNDLLQFSALRNRWAIAEHLLGATSSKPSGKWKKDALALAKGAGQEIVISQITEWLSLIINDTMSHQQVLDCFCLREIGYQMAVVNHWDQSGLSHEDMATPFIHLAFAETYPLITDDNMSPTERIYQQYHNHPLVLSEVNAALARGAIWMLCILNENGFQTDIEFFEKLANSFLKVYPRGNYGSITRVQRSLAAANACFYAIGLDGSKDAITTLCRVKNSMRDGRIRKQIDKTILQISEKTGVSVQELEEISVPDFGLDNETWVEQLEDGAELQLSILGAGAQITCVSSAGKFLKTVPAIVKKTDAFREMKSVADEISAVLPTVKHRLDSCYLRQQIWKASDWWDRYVGHPIAGIVSKPLIWWVIQGNEMKSAIWQDGKMVNVDGQPVETMATNIRLWHPVEDTVDHVQSWRKYLIDNKITQPFKQAHREIYLLTDAERKTATYSNRFAAHILKQHQYIALAKLRNWKASHRMWVDAATNEPTWIDIPAYKLWAEIQIVAPAANDDFEPETLDSLAYVYVTTDQIRFHHGNDLVPLEDIPPIVFSEVMRDCDLFVGVASIGNDQNWVNCGADAATPNQWNEEANRYWHRRSFGDLAEGAKIRRDLLIDILPSLKIANQCRIEDRFLIVEGKLKTYKIHLNSGSILMSPRDQYLCIIPENIPKSKKERIYMPFEGDATFSVILSKALLLANDDKIEDKTISNQIK
ncbi:MAG: DUF4132 domain-containing protein [Hyphomicrobiales bacterium]